MSSRKMEVPEDRATGEFAKMFMEPKPLASTLNGPQTARTFRHNKRGTTYTEVGTAWLQSEEPIREGVPLMIYKGDDGKLWARPFNEFMDGRFTEIPTPPEPECDLEYLPSSDVHGGGGGHG